MTVEGEQRLRPRTHWDGDSTPHSTQVFILLTIRQWHFIKLKLEFQFLRWCGLKNFLKLVVRIFLLEWPLFPKSLYLQANSEYVTLFDFRTVQNQTNTWDFDAWNSFALFIRKNMQTYQDFQLQNEKKEILKWPTAEQSRCFSRTWETYPQGHTQHLSGRSCVFAYLPEDKSGEQAAVFLFFVIKLILLVIKLKHERKLPRLYLKWSSWISGKTHTS